MLSELLGMLGSVVAIWVFLLKTFIYWAPFVFFPLAYRFYKDYKFIKYDSFFDWKLLEIKIPKEIKKTPLAMEIVLSALHQPSAGTWYERLMDGKVAAWFSLEIASFGGSVHFFIRTPRIYRPLIEAQIYAQYPSVEVVEAEDYTLQVDYKRTQDSKWIGFGVEYKLAKPDAYPIKTYVDFGLDREGVKDEERTDPMSTDLELLGLINRDEQMWVQFLVTATRDRFRGKKKHWWTKHVYHDWKMEGQDIIDDILDRKKSADLSSAFKKLSPIEDMAVKAIERNISKLGYDCGMRVMYFSQSTESLNGTFAKALLGFFKQYGSTSLNAIKPGRITGLDFPWQDYKYFRQKRMVDRMFRAYKRRAYFYGAYKGIKPIILNSEELATLYHLPTGTVEAPMVGRIGSRKGEPPTNLPI